MRFVILFILSLSLFSSEIIIHHDNAYIEPIISVGINNRSIAFGSKNYTKNINRNDSYEHMFSLSRMTIEDKILDHLRFKQIKSDWKDYSLTFPIGDEDCEVLDIRRLGATEEKIDQKFSAARQHTVFGFLKNGMIVTGGESGILEAYSTDGEKMAQFIGHNDTVNVLATYGEWLVSGGDDGLIKVWNISSLIKGKKKIHPSITLYYANNDEWVAWTEDGYFSSSIYGADLISFSIGEEKFTSEQLFKKLYRPDLLQAKIKKSRWYDKILALGIEGISEGVSPPSVSFINLESTSSSRDIELQMQVCDNGGGIQELLLYLQGSPISIEEAARALKKVSRSTTNTKCFSYTRNISLLDGDNKLILIATNTKDIESKPATYNINYTGNTSTKPELHLLSIAVDKYTDSRLTLKYSIKDARAIEEIFSDIGIGQFKKTHIYSLKDKEVTKENMMNIFEKIGKKVKPNDVFILYLAGHGVSDPNSATYYFLPSNIVYNSYEQVLEDSISSYDLRNMTSKIQTLHSLLLIDTCQSGSLKGFDNKMLVVDSAQTRFISTVSRATIMASSKDQVAFEGYKGHGAFTYILLEALQGKADLSQDNKLSVDEVSLYINLHLPALTQKKWGYKQEPQRNLIGGNFILGIIP